MLKEDKIVIINRFKQFMNDIDPDKLENDDLDDLVYEISLMISCLKNEAEVTIIDKNNIIGRPACT